MSKELIVSSSGLETKLAIIEDDQVVEIFFERRSHQGILGNIYKGKVMKVLPGMQAAFVDIGLDRHAFLYVADFFEDFEEYEQFFEPEDRTDSLFKERAEGDRPAPSQGDRRKKRGRRARRNGRNGLTTEDAGRPIEPLPGDASTERAAPESTRNLLPSRLEVNGVSPADPAMPALGRDVAIRGILPDRLAGRAASDPAKSESSATLEEKPQLARYRTKRQGNGTGNAPRNANGRRPLIGDMLRAGQEILVQVAKEPIGQKGARITSHIALPGRHLVYMPTVEHVGISRKISDEKERARLREIVLRLRGEGSKGFIVRTAGEKQTEQSIAADINYLQRLWNAVKSKADSRTAPALIHSEPALVQRIIRDRLSDEFRTIRVDDETEYERIIEFVNALAPEMVRRVRLYLDRKPIFDAFGVTSEIEKALKHKVWLRNGGHIVINQTEALVAIDVNTGRFVGKTDSLEDTITRTNLDAVREVVRQIRLRDLGGIIIIDFIDMDESRNRQKVMEALQNELSKDKSPSKILKFNEFGLVALTRKRAKQSLEKVLCQPCIFCSGTGVTKSARTVAYSIHQEVRRMRSSLGERPELLIRCHPEVAKFLHSQEKRILDEIGQLTQKIVTVSSDPTMHIEQFDLVET